MFPEEDDHGACAGRPWDAFVASIIGTNSRIVMKLGKGGWTALFPVRSTAYLGDGMHRLCSTGFYFASAVLQETLQKRKRTSSLDGDGSALILTDC